MHRSNQHFNILPPSPGKTWVLTILLARGVGNLTGRPSRGAEFDLCLGEVGKIEPEVSGFNFFFSEMTGKNICERLVYRKRSSKVVKYFLRRVRKAQSA